MKFYLNLGWFELKTNVLKNEIVVMTVHKLIFVGCARAPEMEKHTVPPDIRRLL